MKKLLLVLCLAPTVLMAQIKTTAELPKATSNMVKVNSFKKLDIVSPVRVQQQSAGSTAVNSRGSRAAGYKQNISQIGTTTYDLQTNNSLARRMILYSGGKVSVVWTSSSVFDQNFADRGAAYVNFDGTKWSTQNTKRLEPDRSGWPNLINYTDSGTSKEGIISHYAAGGTSLSGGSYWLKNHNVGDNSFYTFLDRTKTPGLLWPRAAVTGRYIHVIGVTASGTMNHGIKDPEIYLKYDIITGKLIKNGVLIPGYDSTRYAQGSADEYSIDANGATVAILIGGATNDLALFKSNDSGATWKKTIIDSFKPAPWSARIDNVFDTTLSNDGTGTVMVDKRGNCHVFYSPQRVINQTQGDSSYSFFADNRGLNYWNDSSKTKVRIAGVLDLDGDGTINVVAGTFQSNIAGYGGNNLTTFAQGSYDANGNIYCVYSAPVETDLTIDGSANFRHVYIVFSTDGGKTWAAPQDLTRPTQLECAFGNTTKLCDNNLHLCWMQDATPGINLVNTALPIAQNQIMYSSIPLDDILANKLGFMPDNSASIASNNIPAFDQVSLFPNPATQTTRLSVRLNASTVATVRIIDLMGKVVFEQESSKLPAGTTTIDMNVAGLSAGVYMCQFTAGNSTTSQKLIVQK